jgi:hypothetical protein
MGRRKYKIKAKSISALAPVEACGPGCCFSLITLRPNRSSPLHCVHPVGGTSKLFDATGAQIRGAIHALVHRAVESGDIRPISTLSICSGLLSVCRNVASVPELATKRQEIGSTFSSWVPGRSSFQRQQRKSHSRTLPQVQIYEPSVA